MATDDLATQGARASTTMVFAMLKEIIISNVILVADGIEPLNSAAWPVMTKFVSSMCIHVWTLGIHV